jgi:hypothetical protein
VRKTYQIRHERGDYNEEQEDIDDSGYWSSDDLPVEESEEVTDSYFYDHLYDKNDRKLPPKEHLPTSHYDLKSLSEDHKSPPEDLKSPSEDLESPPEDVLSVDDRLESPSGFLQVLKQMEFSLKMRNNLEMLYHPQCFPLSKSVLTLASILVLIVL